MVKPHMLLALLLGLFLAATAAAANFSGTITKVATRTFTVKRGSVEKTFTVGENTEVTRSGKRIRFAELKVGQSVTVIYETVEGKDVAQEVVVEAPERERHENKP